LRAWALGSLTGAERRIGVQLSLELSRSLRVLRALEALALPTQLRRVALRLWEGANAAQVATELGVSAASMKSYRKELYARLEVHSVDELRGLLDAQARAVTLDLARHQPRPSDLPPGG
jgi:DNA-binding NarL/FixJ family response regulator